MENGRLVYLMFFSAGLGHRASRRCALVQSSPKQKFRRIALAEAAKKWLRSASASGEPWVMRRKSSCTSTDGVNVDSLPYMRELARRRSSGYSRSDERGVGTEGVTACRSRWCPFPKKK